MTKIELIPNCKDKNIICPIIINYWESIRRQQNVTTRLSPALLKQMCMSF